MGNRTFGKAASMSKYRYPNGDSKLVGDILSRSHHDVNSHNQVSACKLIFDNIDYLELIQSVQYLT